MQCYVIMFMHLYVQISAGAEDGDFWVPPLPDSEEDSDEEEESTEEPELAQFREVTEVRFPAEVGPLGGQRVCKIKCVEGEWVGPLCALNEQGMTLLHRVQT